MKALHKDPARRYGSAAELGDDIHRYLARLPVTARRDTVGYRLSKFVRRHTVGVVAFFLVLAALGGGIIATTQQARVAERRFSDVRTLANTLLSDLHDAIRDLPGATPARRLLVNNALLYLDNLNRETGHDPTLQLELADAYEQIGEIQGDPHYTNLGDLAGAMTSYRKAFALREALWQQYPADAAVQHALAKSFGRLAVVTSRSDDNDEAIVLSRQALDLLVPLARQHPENDEIQHDLGSIRSELGWWLIWATRNRDGIAHLAEAVQLLESLAARRPDDLDLQLHLWRAYSYQVDGLRFTGRHRAALDLLEHKAFVHLQRLHRRYPTQPRVRYSLHTCYDFIGVMYEALDDLERAIPAYQAALDLAEALVGSDSTNQKAHEALARSHGSVGRVLAGKGRFDEAIASYQRTAAIQRALYRKNPSNTELGNMLGTGRRTLCRILLDAGRHDTALEQCLEGVAVYEELVASTRESEIVRANLGSVYTYTARIYRALAQRAPIPAERRQHVRDALAWYDRAVTIFDGLKTTADGATIDWEIHPDSLSAECDAFIRRQKRWR